MTECLITSKQLAERLGRNQTSLLIWLKQGGVTPTKQQAEHPRGYLWDEKAVAAAVAYLESVPRYTGRHRPRKDQPERRKA